MDRRLRITARNLIYLHLYIDLVVNLIKNVSSAFSVFAYIPDIINCILLVFIFRKCLQQELRKSELFLLCYILLLLIYDIVSCVFQSPNNILFLWGIRNQYRFLIFCLSSCIFLRREDLFKLEKILYKSFFLNIIAVAVEFSLGYKRDFLGGLFGVEHNCNGMTNVYLILVCTYAILCFMYKRRKTSQVAFMILGSAAWAALAELKIFYLEICIIAYILFVMIKGKTVRKIYIAVSGICVAVGSIVLLIVVFPEQAFVFNTMGGMLSYAKNVNVGAYGFGRTSGLSIVRKIFFDGDLLKNVFGLCVGNAEKLEMGSLKLYSDFYKQYEIYSYYGYYYPYLYIERGALGLFWYLILFGIGIKKSINMVKGKILDIAPKMISILCILIPFICFYDGSLKVSASGYIAFLVLGLAFNDKLTDSL